MAKKVKSYRLEDVLVDRIAAYAKSRGSSETQVIEAAAESFLDLAQRGVPELPVVASRSRKPPAEKANAAWVETMGARQARLNDAKGSR